jgi:hypothetical protein
MSGTYPFAIPQGPPRQYAMWPANAAPYMVYVDSNNGYCYICPGRIRCPDTSPETVVDCPWSYLAWKPQFPGKAWIAITVSQDGVPTAVEALAGESVPASTRHAPDRLNLDGTTTAGHGGTCRIMVAEFLGGPGNPIRQIVGDDIVWTSPEPETLATLATVRVPDADGHIVSMTIESGRIKSTTVAAGSGGGGGGTTIPWIELTTAEYEALDPPDADTVYDINDLE